MERLPDFVERVSSNTRMTDGTPHGSPLSPALWLICIAHTLNTVDQRCQNIHTPRRSSTRLPPSSGEGTSVLIIRYADDVNSLVFIKKSGIREHRKAVGKIDQILVEEAGKDKLRWDPAKESHVEFGGNKKDSTSTLGILINSRLR